MIARNNITGMILAGGQATRMGGIDKGLQDFQGKPLVQHAIDRFAPQVHTLYISANRHHERYVQWGWPVLKDALCLQSDGSRSAASQVDFAGPLAGIFSGLQRCATPYLAVIPCDAPWLPLDLVSRLSQSLEQSQALLSFAASQETSGLRHHPVFCLLKTSLVSSLESFLQDGGRKVQIWMMRHPHVVVTYPAHADANYLTTDSAYRPNAFSNINDLETLAALQNQLEPR